MFIWDIIPTNSTVSRFYFPLSKDDLLSNDFDSNIILLSEDEVLQSIGSVSIDITSSPLYILIHFDLLASVLFHFSKIPVTQIVETLNSFFAAGKEFIELIQLLSPSEPNRTEVNDRRLFISSCCLMRLVYLISEWMSEIFRIMNLDKHFDSEKSKSSSNFKDINLHSLCQKSIELISLFLSSKIQLVFIQSNQECLIEAIRFILNPIYLFLSRNTLVQKYGPTVVECICQCLKRFSSLLIETSVKISEILQLDYQGVPSQNLSTSLLKFFDQLITCNPNLGGQILREIVNRIDLERDSSEIRIFGMMLAVISSYITELECSNINIVIPLLSAECYTVRNGALSAIAHMIRLDAEKTVDRSYNVRNQLEIHFDVDISPDSNDVPLLTYLVQSIFDCNAFVRARCVTLLASLWENGFIPINQQNGILNIVIGRLHDKCALVRKNILALLVISLRQNPFKTVSLDLSAFQKSLDREVGLLKDIQGNDTAKSNVLEINDIESNIHPDIEDIITSGECLYNSTNPENTDAEELFTRLESEITIGYLPDCITALHLLKKFHPDNRLFNILGQTDDGSKEIILGLTKNDLLVLSTLLRIKTMGKTKNEEVDMEGIDNQKNKISFLRTGISFIENFSLSLKDVLCLIRSKTHSDVTSAISYLGEYSKFKLPDHLICTKPIFFLIWSNHQTHRNCALECFFEIFFTKIEENSAQQQIYLLIAENLCKFICSDLSYGEFFTFEEIIVSLMKEKKIPEIIIKTLFQMFKGDIKTESVNFDLQLHALILISMIGKGDPSVLSRHMDVIFELCFRKNTLNLDLGRYGSVALNSMHYTPNNNQINCVKRLPCTNQVFNSMHILITSTLTDSTKNWVPFTVETLHVIFELAQDPFKIFSEIILHCSSIIKCITLESKKIIGMSRFICLLGKVAQLHILLSEKYLLKSEKSTLNSTMTCSPADQKFDSGLLARYEGLIIPILQTTDFYLPPTSNLQKTAHPILLQLQSSSLFALSQYMLLSSDLCEQNLDLLFTLLSKHPSSSIRESCICAVSDLILRFPNLLQPWIPFIFNSLHDPSSSVRKHSILIISHLILIDMIKIQGHVAEIAYLLLDSDDIISEIARRFFSNISLKGNALYNSLADILSNILDVNTLSLDTDKLKFILKYLISFIQKEKQVDNLVEKLIARLKTAQDSKRRELIGYSISLLPHSDRTLKILVSEFSLIKLLVHDELTKSHFVSISKSLHKKSSTSQEENKLLVLYDNLLDSIECDNSEAN